MKSLALFLLCLNFAFLSARSETPYTRYRREENESHQREQTNVKKIVGKSPGNVRKYYRCYEVTEPIDVRRKESHFGTDGIGDGFHALPVAATNDWAPNSNRRTESNQQIFAHLPKKQLLERLKVNYKEERRATPGTRKTSDHGSRTLPESSGEPSEAITISADSRRSPLSRSKTATASSKVSSSVQTEKTESLPVSSSELPTSQSDLLPAIDDSLAPYYYEMKAPTVSATKSTESKTSLNSEQTSSNIQGFDPFFEESSGTGQEPLRSPSIAKGSGEAVLIRKSVVISKTGHIERPSSSYTKYGRDPEIIEEIVSNSKAVTPKLKSKAFGDVFDSEEDKAAEEFDYGEEIDAESSNAPVLISPKVKSSANSAKKTRQNGSHGANRRPNRIRSGTNRYVPRARVFPSPQQEVQLSTASISGAPAPIAYRLSPEHCDQIKNIAKMYGIVDVVSWIRHNCKFAQAYFPGYTCKQMNEYVASCY